MKQIKLIIHEPSLNKVVGGDFPLQLDDGASLIDAINEVDRLINQKGGFPLIEYRSLLHMIYNPLENRFYKQVAVAAYREGEDMINLRVDPKQKLPNGVTVVLIPAGGCISEWEETVNFDDFSKVIPKG